MMNVKLLTRLLYSLLFTITLIFSSCQGFIDYVKDQFPEVDTSTYINIEGTFMAPLVNSTIYINDFLPEAPDSSRFWLEVDNTLLIHYKKYFDSVFVVSGVDLDINSTLPADTPIGPIPLPPILVSQSLPIPADIPGSLEFKGLNFKFFITNFLPVVVNFNIDSIHFINTYTEEDYKAQTSISFTINPSTDDPIVIDSSNFPDISEALVIKPDRVKFILSGTVPNQQTQGQFNPSDIIYSDLLVDLPLYLYADDIVLSDTVDLDLQLEDTIIKDVLIKAIAENNIPLGGTVYLAIVNSTVTDTIAVITNPDFAQSLDTLNITVGTKFVSLRPVVDLLPAETNLDGETINPKISVSKLHLSNTNIVNLQNAGEDTKLLIFAKFNTYNSSNEWFVKILSTNYINLKLGAKIEYAGSF